MLTTPAQARELVARIEPERRADPTLLTPLEKLLIELAAKSGEASLPEYMAGPTSIPQSAASLARSHDRAAWPLLARTISKLARTEDRGLGDIVARHLNKFGGLSLKEMYARLTGVDCGCSDRQDKLNERFPLK